ncbi:cytochrome C oxidase subunit IV family protein [Staphylospora marina]|uniref:cytochrome C oxidase subunit IV family protein n=1 Tax=Staphylospora marina TaxID=2490858 RepID=UPI000F5BFA49|nr:cytochrome C oxidase subunit IV family protein [Staphylospora marina]
MANHHDTAGKPASHKPETATKHVISFVVMIVLTAAAFYLVATDVVAEHLVLPLMLILAAIQVLLQLFVFMHLDRKGSGFITAFMVLGIVIAVVSAVGIILM